MDPVHYEVNSNIPLIRDYTDRIKQGIAGVMVGQDRMVELLLTALLADGHVLIEGVPGIGKTLMVKLLSKSLHLAFSRIQFTPDLMPADILGTTIFHPKLGEFQFKKGPVFSHLVLIDEINRAPAKTQSALFEVMEEKQITLDGQSWVLPPPFMVVATQNPVEYEGTYRLPEAQLDRFLIKINIHYPGLEEEIEILNRFHHNRQEVLLDKVATVIDGAALIHLRSLVKQQKVSPEIIRYIATIVHHTRANKHLFLGASPRASLALLNAAKAFSVLQGRDFVLPDDVKNIGKEVLRHRIQLSPEKELEGKTTDDVITELFNQIEVPK